MKTDRYFDDMVDKFAKIGYETYDTLEYNDRTYEISFLGRDGNVIRIKKDEAVKENVLSDSELLYFEKEEMKLALYAMEYCIEWCTEEDLKEGFDG